MKNDKKPGTPLEKPQESTEIPKIPIDFPEYL